MNPPWLKQRAEGVQLSVWVQPRASRTEIAGESGGWLKIRVTEPPVDNAANSAVARFLAARTRRPMSAVHLARGHSGRRKIFVIDGLGRSEALAALTPPSGGATGKAA